MIGPPNEKGALLQVPIPKTAAVREYVACRHTATVEVVLPPGCFYHATKRCLHCGVFLKWLPKPHTLGRRRLTALKLAQLDTWKALSTWQRRLVRDLSLREKLSPPQQETLDQLCATYLECKTP